LTTTEKRGFRLSHGSNSLPLALDPGTFPRCDCKVNLAPKSALDFGSTQREKRRFPVAHGAYW